MLQRTTRKCKRQGRVSRCLCSLIGAGKILLVQALGSGFNMSILHQVLLMFFQMMEAKTRTHYALTINPDHEYVVLLKHTKNTEQRGNLIYWLWLWE